MPPMFGFDRNRGVHRRLCREFRSRRRLRFVDLDPWWLRPFRGRELRAPCRRRAARRRRRRSSWCRASRSSACMLEAGPNSSTRFCIPPENAERSRLLNVGLWCGAEHFLCGELWFWRSKSWGTSLTLLTTFFLGDFFDRIDFLLGRFDRDRHFVFARILAARR